MSLILNGDTGVQGNSGAFVAGTAVASTSGTSIDFTSIPSWVKRVTVMFNGVSINGSSNIQVQIGSGSVTTSGYTTTMSYVTTSNSNASSNGVTSGIPIWALGASYSYTGAFILTLLNSSTNLWVCSAVIGATGTYMLSSSGSVSLSGTLDRIRCTTTNGTDTFDAGSINILYE